MATTASSTAQPQAQGHAQAQALAQAQVQTQAQPRSSSPFDAFDPFDPFDAFDFPSAGVSAGAGLFAWPFAAATLAPALPASASFTFPWHPPQSALATPVPVWRADTGAVGPKLALDLIELPDRYVANADLPGVQSGDIDIRVDRDAQLISITVVRRRVANCDCNLVPRAAPAPAAAPPAATSAAAAAATSAGASAGASAGTTTSTTGSADAKSHSQVNTYACDGACAAKAIHCRDCEAKGETMAHAAPTVPLVAGCCGFCAGALRLKGQPKCGRGARCDARAGANATDNALYRRSERQFGRAERSFRVPADADTGAVTSSLRGGVLSVSVPRIRGAGAGASKATTKADAKVQADAAAQLRRDHKAVGGAAAAVAADANARARVLTHHVTAQTDNPTVRHERVMRQAVAAAADPVRRAALLRHHMSRADPLDAWQYRSPYSAYQSVLRDAVALARDFDMVATHVPRPPYDTAETNPILQHERAMRLAVGVAQAHAARADVHAAAAARDRAVADAQMTAAAASAAAAEQAANAAAANAEAFSM